MGESVEVNNIHTYTVPSARKGGLRGGGGCLRISGTKGEHSHASHMFPLCSMRGNCQLEQVSPQAFVIFQVIRFLCSLNPRFHS